MINSLGVPTWIFKSGEEVKIRLHFEADQDYPRPIFAIDIHRFDRVMVGSIKNYDTHPTQLPIKRGQMPEIVRKEMEAGALGIGSSLIYAPAFYAPTEELIEMCKVAANYQGKYISHMRSEGNRLIEGVEELLRIAREAGIPAVQPGP